MMRRVGTSAVLALAVSLAACNGDGSGAATTAAPAGGPSAVAGKATPDAGGKVIEVGMYTDEQGNYFEPANFEASKGDVIRFVLKTGVHNAHFVADSSSGASLPEMTPYLQLPGQTYDVKVGMEPGSHFYQCDPHALLGMVGRVTVK